MLQSLKSKNLHSIFAAVFALAAFAIGLIPQDAANPWMSVPFVLFSAYLILSGRISTLNSRDPVLLLLVILWLGWVWGSLFSPVPFASEVTLLVLGILPVSYLYALNRDIKPALYGICAIVTLLAAAGIAQITMLPIHPWRAKLFFSDENTLGAIIACAIPLTLGFCLSIEKRAFKILLYIMLAILVGGLAYTQSRSALVGCVFGIVAISFKNKNFVSFRTLKFAVPVFLILTGVIFTTTFGERIVDAFGSDKDVLGRIAIWTSALKMTLIDPVRGVGLATFHLHYPPYKTLHDNSAGYWVHMDPLQWAVETGWATAFVFYALSACIFFKYLRSDLTQLQIGAGASLLTVFLIAHVGYPLHCVPILILTGFLLAQFAPPSAVTVLFHHRHVIAISLTIVLLCNLWGATRVGPTLYFWTQSERAFKSGNAVAYTKNLRDCIEKGDARYPGCFLEGARIVIQGQEHPPEDVLDWLLLAERANPLSGDPALLRAQYYLKKNPGNPDFAIRELKESLERNPALWFARRLLVNLLAGQRKYPEAFDVLEDARKRQIDANYLNEFYAMETELLKKVGK